jgi:hypothetical protein
MRIQLISHASVLIETGDATIWTDPWLFGKAFNESWSLLPAPSWDPSLLSKIDHIWISHEHPDHFHIPTLRSLPKEFKERVTVLYQQNNSEKMFKAFSKLGFAKWRALPHREIVSITPETLVYCYHEGPMNSALAVRSGGQTVFNINDAELRTPDCRLVKQDIGSIDVVLNQFSIAGGPTRRDHAAQLRSVARSILQNIADNHADLGARTTIPFASFVYFSTNDNRHVNEYANSLKDVQKTFDERGLRVVLLLPGDGFEVGGSFDNAAAVQRHETIRRTMDSLPYDEPVRVTREEIASALQRETQRLRERYPALLLGLLRPVVFDLTDLGERLAVSFSTGQMQNTSSPADIRTNSQPLLFALSNDFGFQTLGVSGRYEVLAGERNWLAHRLLFSMNNAELFLKPKLLFRKENLYFLRRLRGGPAQFWMRVVDTLGGGSAPSSGARPPSA